MLNSKLPGWAWILLVSSLLFLIFLPLSWSIDFMQNDDWNRYKTASSFLAGDFRLLDVTATTFYTQGFMGAAFAKIFSVNRLPVLTLLFGCLNFYLFAQILNKIFKMEPTKAILAGLVLFFNPLHFYSLFGFMTEVYLLTFCLAAIYFYYRGEFWQANISWILGFFAKQWAIVFPAAYFAREVLRKSWKKAAFQLLILLAVLGYYFFFFPQTNEMAEQKSFEPRNFKSVKYMFTHAYAYFICLAIFSFPFIWSLIVRKISWVYFTIAAILSIVIKLLFNQTAYPWKTFPLYPNIFTEKGFFLIGIEGEVQKSVYAPLFNFLDEIGLFSLMYLVLIFIGRRFKSTLNFESLSILIGYFLIVGTPFVFDRYLLIFVPVAIIFLLRLSKFKFNFWILAVFLLIQTVISIDYGVEYVNRQHLIWNHAEQIHSEENVPRDKIIASHAWNKYYGLNASEAMYWFRYSNFIEDGNEKVAREFWSQGIFTKVNLDIIRIQNR